MDLFSDFNDTKWSDKGNPPEDLKTLEGYETMNMLRTNKEEKPDGERIFTYYMTSDSGIPSQAVMYGAERDPLKSIGHCFMKITDKNNLPLVTGCIVEDDWVEMQQQYLDSLDVHGPEKIEVKPARLSMIIGLAGDVQADKWEKKHNPPKNKSGLGYIYVTIIRCAPTEEKGTFTYYITDQDGRPLQAYLVGADRDPLRSVGNCFLKLVKEDSKDMIKGMIVDDDWVEKL